MISAALKAKVAEWRKTALAIIRGEVASTESERDTAWRFLRQWGVK